MTDDQQKNATKSRMVFMLICVGILFAAIFISKFIQKYINYRRMMAQSQAITVSAMQVSYATWQPHIIASGSVRAIKGVNVTTSLAGMVQTIYFKPGAIVKEGDVLVQLNADAEIGTLHSLQASAELARITYERDKKQLAVKAISQQTLDTDLQNLKNLQAQVESQAATVAKKTLIAPFSGRLGISAVNPGQYLNTGDKVTTLQTFDPIYVDFYVPQQELERLNVGQTVTATTDALKGKKFIGKITTIDPAVDINTRNVEVEATVPNPDTTLTPGMFVNVVVDVGTPERYLTVPQTVVSFNSYGDIVYVIRPKESEDKTKSTMIAHQVFVVTGQTRGDQITILKGIKEGDTVVTSGQLKLRNGAEVAINNKVAPSNNSAPSVSNEHIDS
ncbi:MAG: efflux RND transporter periplasmic adaptor subunit [Gammaproteobacteria bacterium]